MTVKPQEGRKANGRFDLGNRHSFTGGRARAVKLSAERRREIAALGFAALADRHFDGDRRAAAEWLRTAGVLAGLFGRAYAQRAAPLPRSGAT